MTVAGDGAQVPEDLSLTVAAVARRLGVAPATLRTWDRRYGVGPSEHRPGAHRRYTSDDLARLDRMRRLVIAGVPPAEAARASLTDAPLPDAEVRDVPETAARSGGGNVIALPGGGPAVRGLARAASALDSTACHDLIVDALSDAGAVATWNDVIVPVLTALGEKWRDTGRGVEIEHALSAVVVDALSGWIRTCAPSTQGRAVILACAPGEQHALPLWAVSAALAERGVGARILGASLPDDALANVIRRIGPAAVLVWAQVEETADARSLGELPSTRPPATILIAGPGWHTVSDDGPRWVGSLQEAVDSILHALGRVA
jgi:transposase-like protein